jgi:hypothetical protein
MYFARPIEDLLGPKNKVARWLGVAESAVSRGSASLLERRQVDSDKPVPIVSIHAPARGATLRQAAAGGVDPGGNAGGVLHHYGVGRGSTLKTKSYRLKVVRH